MNILGELPDENSGKSGKYDQTVDRFKKGSIGSSVVVQKDYDQTVDRFISTDYKQSTGLSTEASINSHFSRLFSHSSHLKTVKTLDFLFQNPQNPFSYHRSSH